MNETATKAEVIAVLSRLADHLGVAANDRTGETGEGSYKRRINFYPDTQIMKAWVNRAEDTVNSIGLNLQNNKKNRGMVTYGPDTFKGEQEWIFQREF